MSIGSLVLVLLASMTHACWNYLAKKTSGGVSFAWLVYTASTFIFLPFALTLAFDWTFNPYIAGLCLISGALRLGYFLLLQSGYRNGDLSLVYPLARGSAPLFTGIGAIAILRETPNVYTVSGLILITAGVLIITKPRFAPSDTKLKTGTLYGLSTGLVIAVYTIWDKIAIGENINPLVLTFTSHVMGACFLAPFALRNKNKLKETFANHKWTAVAIGALSPVSYLLVLQAMTTTDVLYIAPVREVSILFGVLIGGHFMSEQDSQRRMIAGCFILAGIVILAI